MLIDELRALREKQAEHRRLLGKKYQDHGLVFSQRSGRPEHAHNIVRRDFHKVLERAKLPRIRFHDLRHCQATLLLLQGTHPKVVQERLGHSAIGITMDTYPHVLPGLQEQAVQRLQERLFGAAPDLHLNRAGSGGEGKSPKGA